MLPYLEMYVILFEFSANPYNVGGGLGLVGMCKPIGSIDISALDEVLLSLKIFKSTCNHDFFTSTHLARVLVEHL
jgi:hypothetical protein